MVNVVSLIIVTIVTAKMMTWICESKSLPPPLPSSPASVPGNHQHVIVTYIIITIKHVIIIITIIIIIINTIIIAIIITVIVITRAMKPNLVNALEYNLSYNFCCQIGIVKIIVIIVNLIIIVSIIIIATIIIIIIIAPSTSLRQ